MLSRAVANFVNAIALGWRISERTDAVRGTEVCIPNLLGESTHPGSVGTSSELLKTCPCGAFSRWYRKPGNDIWELGTGSRKTPKIAWSWSRSKTPLYSSRMIAHDWPAS